jgi:hypothetical protein
MSFAAKYFRAVFVLSLLLLCVCGAQAQTPNASEISPESSKQQLKSDDEEPYCKKTGDAMLDEMRIKLCIKHQQKEFQELLDNGEEAAKISTELEKSFEKSSSLAVEDQKKLDRLEKLCKKIRNSLGGEDDEAPVIAEDKPLSLKTAVTTLSEKASNLLDELKKTTRYSISVVAIQSSNTVIKLVKFIRFSKN